MHTNTTIYLGPRYVFKTTVCIEKTKSLHHDHLLQRFCPVDKTLVPSQTLPFAWNFPYSCISETSWIWKYSHFIRWFDTDGTITSISALVHIVHKCLTSWESGTPGESESAFYPFWFIIGASDDATTVSPTSVHCGPKVLSDWSNLRISFIYWILNYFYNLLKNLHWLFSRYWGKVRHMTHSS